MGIMNWIVQKTMINEARRIAEWARKNYDSVKAQNPDLTDEEIHVRIEYDVDKLSNISDESKNIIQKCCQTIEGLCYMHAMTGNLKDFMIFRLVQFTKYMDHYLYTLGFKQQTKEQKENILKTLGIYFEGW
ncbi:MAG: hypothetical protein XE08_0421 [Parcubacteria bacterium 32_520]|nr:MAG: hypothetical protein XE08_0421 [Parcubacteria bacterium 32_520]